MDFENTGSYEGGGLVQRYGQQLFDRLRDNQKFNNKGAGIMTNGNPPITRIELILQGDDIDKKDWELMINDEMNYLDQHVELEISVALNGNKLNIEIKNK